MVDSVALDFAYRAQMGRDLHVGGVVVPDDPEIITPAIRRAMLENRFEASEAAQIPQVVRPGDRVIEIGAGIGFISTLLSRERGVRSVVAVEANPHLIGYMKRLHAANGVRKVRPLNVVLDAADAPGLATFYLRRDFWMGSLSPRPNAYYGTVEVPTMNFSALLRAEAASLVVCDVEGAESFLFEDADLTTVDRIFLEMHDHVTGLGGIARLFGTLAGQGFVYDPRHSCGSVVLFRKLVHPDLPRPYRG